MLWNAASDDAGSTSYGRNDDDDTEYDTYGKSSSLSDDGDNSGDTELADTDWGTHSYRYFSSQAAGSLVICSPATSSCRRSWRERNYATRH